MATRCKPCQRKINDDLRGRERRAARLRFRYQNDPEFRERKKKMMAERFTFLYRTNAVFRERHMREERERHRRKAKAKISAPDPAMLSVSKRSGFAVALGDAQSTPQAVNPGVEMTHVDE